MDEAGLLQFLTENGIAYQRFDHPAVYTVDQARQVLGDAPGAGTKNLLLWEKHTGRCIFVMVGEARRIDIRQLRQALGTGDLQFAPPQLLRQHLGIEPGAVTALALVNDTARALTVVVDRELWQAEALQCHPIVNTATLVISQPDLERFFALTGHAIQILDIPVKT
jgi:Ala-tRNA(Pro) deacylase